MSEIHQLMMLIWVIGWIYGCGMYYNESEFVTASHNVARFIILIVVWPFYVGNRSGN